jgi:LuxR family maltose regulon positive regulatory protein
VAQRQPEAAGTPRLDDDLVSRPRLLTGMHVPARVRLLRAPIGFGKTTLVAQWIAGRDLGTEHVAWLRVRPVIEDVAHYAET